MTQSGHRLISRSLPSRSRFDARERRHCPNFLISSGVSDSHQPMIELTKCVMLSCYLPAKVYFGVVQKEYFVAHAEGPIKLEESGEA